MISFKIAGVLFLFTFKTIKGEPDFMGSETNASVVLGRDATLTCRVQDLNSFKVAWLRVDTQTILTIGVHVITKNHRVAVAHSDSQTWSLIVRDVKLADRGSYMCQINTEPMITQTHHLEVLVPPDIVDSGSSEVLVREGDNMSVYCSASGIPAPNITWRREDFQDMTVLGQSASKWTGEWLNITSANRSMNGALLCIATNGVPPTVSKRILLHVLCKPSARVPHKMLGGFLGSSVLLQCKVEAYPTPVIYWTHVDGRKLKNGSKHHTSVLSQGYRHTSALLVKNVSRHDIGSFSCHAENVLGSATDDVTLYTLATATTSSTSTAITEKTTSASQTYPTSVHSLMHLDAELISDEKKFQEDGNIVILISQHQMQSFDMAPSS